jgi:hypothetical protein
LLNTNSLSDIIHNPSLARQDAILLILAVEVDTPKPVSKIKSIAGEVGLRSVEKWNVSDILLRSKHLATKIKDGWILTIHGKNHIATFSPSLKSSASTKVGMEIKDLFNTISDESTRSFLEETLSCFNNNNLRASVVLSWVGAVSLLQNFVFTNVLAAFNSEALRRNPKWQEAKSTDDIGRMKEKDFLDILVAISVLGKNVKQELEYCLTLRNGCGHPNSLKIGEQRVVAHLETLILNVYTKFI